MDEADRRIGSDELARALVATARGGIVRVAADGRVVDANAEAQRILGLRKDDVGGMYVADYDAHVVDEHGADVPTDRFPVSHTLATGRAAGPSTLGVMRSDGSISWAIYSAVPLHDDDGGTAGAMVTMLDVTDRIEFEAELRRSEERWRALFENIPEFVILLDKDGRLVTINRTVPDMEVADVVGTHFSAFMPPDAARLVDERLAHVFATGETVSFEVEAQGADETLEWYEDVVAPMRARGEIVGAIVIARQITARKRLEQELSESRRLAAIGMVAAGIAHEINNPLTYILGNVAHVRANVHDPDLVAALVDAERGAERVRTIVGDLKLLAREPDDTTAPVDLAKVIDGALGILQSELCHRAAVVREHAAMPPVRGNEGRLLQVALNLLINAMQAIPEADRDRHTVRVTTRTCDDGRMGEMVIEDDGEGIEPELLARVFEPFFTTKPTGVGTGLGLAICQGIVDAAGGTIAISSTPGRGTRVTVRLPLHSGEPVAAVEARATPEIRRLHVLVVDDDAAVSRALARSLEPEHTTSVVNDGEQALALLQRQRFDAVLCDVMMPGLSGLDLYERVLARDPEHAARFVMITGGVFSPALRARLDGYGLPCLAKPIDRNALLAAIAARVLDRRTRR